MYIYILVLPTDTGKHMMTSPLRRPIPFQDMRHRLEKLLVLVKLPPSPKIQTADTERHPTVVSIPASYSRDTGLQSWSGD